MNEETFSAARRAAEHFIGVCERLSLDVAKDGWPAGSTFATRLVRAQSKNLSKALLALRRRN